MAGNTVGSDKIVTENMTVVAVLEPVETYTVTFKVNDQVYAEIRVPAGDIIGNNLPVSPMLPGYVFKGWKNANGTVNSGTVVNWNMTVEAVFVGIPTITAGNATGLAGGTVTVPVSISDNIGLTVLDLSIGYNSDVLTLKGVEAGVGSSEAVEALRDFNFKVSDDYDQKPASGNKKIVNFMWDGAAADSTNGSILMLTFDVADDAVLGEYLIDVMVKSASDANFSAARGVL